MIISNNVVIILNGTSSSGKSSIAQEIVNLIEVPIIHAQVDTFFDMFDFSKFKTGSDAFKASKIAFSLFDSSISDICKQDFPIVVDTVFERFEYYQNAMSVIKGRDVYLIGVYCPLTELCVREKKRGDRKLGLASEQFDNVHADKQYELEVDTSKLSSSACAKKIIQLVNKGDIGSHQP